MGLQCLLKPWEGIDSPEEGQDVSADFFKCNLIMD